jgi:hypothetical protein
VLPKWFVDARSRDLKGAEVREEARSSRLGFLIIGLFDRGMGDGCAVRLIPDSENEIVTRELVVRSRGCCYEDQLTVAAGEDGMLFGATRARAISRISSPKS